MARWPVYLCALAIAVLRCGITPRLDLPTAEGSYEACAHLFVGGLIGAWCASRDRREWLALAGALSLFELAAFLLQKFGFASPF